MAQHKGSLFLGGLTELSEEAAKALAQHKGGCLFLGYLIALSDAQASALAHYKGSLSLDGLRELSDEAAKALRTNLKIELPEKFRRRSRWPWPMGR